MIRQTISFVLAAFLFSGIVPANASERTGAGVEIHGPSLIGPGPLGLNARSYPAVPKSGASSQLVDACVTQAMSAANTPGAAVAVLEGGVMTYQQGYGVKRRHGTDPVTPDTQFRIGSITKMLTAAAVMQQAEAGRLNLDDPVTELVPEFAIAAPWNADHITIRHLLTHSSGFPDRMFSVNGPRDDDALSDWAAEQGDVPLHAPPGAFWNYSNPNYMLAGLIVERASGTPYQQYMHEQVFAPAGMTHTTLRPFDVVWNDDWAWGHYTYSNAGQEVELRPDSYDDWRAAPAGLAFSSASDLVYWADLLMTGGGSVLAPRSCDAMQAEQVELHYQSTDYYGFGVFSERYHEVDVKQHGGNVPGWGAFLLWVPESRFAVAVLANTFESLPGAAYCIADQLLGLEHIPAPDETTPVASWKRFEGRYDFVDVFGRPWLGSVTWTPTGLGLEMSLETGEPYLVEGSLVPIFADTFAYDLDDDGVLETDFTFISSPGEPAPTRWMRNRSYVGTLSVPVRQGAGRSTP